MHDRARLEIEEGAQKLETLMIDAVDRNFDRLEIWTLRNVLCLPREDGFENWVRLKHYEGLDVQKRDNALTPEALFALRKKLTETRRLNALLVQEQARNALLVERLRKTLQPAPQHQKPRSSTASEADAAPPPDVAPLAFLTHNKAAQGLGVQPLPAQNSSTTSTSASESRTPLTTHAAFTTSHLPYLKAQLADLKSKLGAAALAQDKKDADAEGERGAERRAYIESQSRRILEKRGVDTRDGVEGNFEAQRVRGEEIAALEGIVGALGGGGKEGGKEGGGAEGDADADAMDTS